MKRKLIAILLALTILTSPVLTMAQDGGDDGAKTTTTAAPKPAKKPAKPSKAAKAAKADPEPIEESSHTVIKNKFIEGGPGFMGLVLVCLILGLAVAIERIITLFMASGNSEAFKDDIEAYLKNKDVEGAKELCRNTPGPIASIYYQGLDRTEEGLQVVEGTVASYGSVQVSKLESGLVWLSLFISLAPMLGFLGTVIGMIKAFDDIQAQGDISPTVVAGGIKIALITTVAGLIVAIILQIFYNFITSKIDSMVGDMENSSIDLVDMMLKNKVVGK
jgi:biopolymer transport protein ExbB